jgi:hypothetical protein
VCPPMAGFFIHALGRWCSRLRNRPVSAACLREQKFPFLVPE